MNEEKRVEIYRGVKGEVVFSVDPDAETLWATQKQMADAFGVDRTVIGRHLRNIFKEGELDEKVVCAKNAHTTQHGAISGKTQVAISNIYNLDAIISVGYRVNSKKATQFRKWATKTLKQYIVNGAAINKRRIKELPNEKLSALEETIGVVRRLVANHTLNADEATGVLEVIARYEKSFKTLEEYDSHHISFGKSKKAKKVLTLEKCQSAIRELKEQTEATELFGKMRGKAFEGGLAAIYQTFDGGDLYPTVSEKAAHLLYFIIKDHPFYDGNKRIGAFLFLIFLTMNDVYLVENGETKISDRALVAIALLIAESDPNEKDLIIALVRKLLD